MLSKIRNNFIAGLAVILPVIVTIVILKFLIVKINNGILDPMAVVFFPFLRGPFVYFAKGLVFLVLFIAVVVIGLATRSLVMRKLFELMEKLFFKVPMAGKIYVTIRQMFDAFLGENKGVFQRVILLEYPRKGIYSIGFVTSESKGEVAAKIQGEAVNVFIPTTPNPTSGVYLVVPKENLMLLDLSVEEALKLVISGGAITSEHQK